MGSALSHDLRPLAPLGLDNLEGVIVGKALYEGRFTRGRGAGRPRTGSDGMSVLKRVIPCLDVDKGRVVKGTNFVDLRDAGDPVELAERYDSEGADELVFLDITASHEVRDTIVQLAAPHGRQRVHPLHDRWWHPLAGDAQAVLDAGADKVSVNSAAVARPGPGQRAADTFGSQCVVVAIDARRDRREGCEVYVHGGRMADRLGTSSSGRAREPSAARARSCSPAWTATEPKDGYDLELTAAVAEAVGIPVIASGGAGRLEHLSEAIRTGGADAVLCASIFHYGTYSVQEAKQHLDRAGIAVRLG